jgi:hypothetical protein
MPLARGTEPWSLFNPALRAQRRAAAHAARLAAGAEGPKLGLRKPTLEEGAQ